MNQSEIINRNLKLKRHMLSLAVPEAWKRNNYLVEESLSLMESSKVWKDIRQVILVGHGTSYATAMNGEIYINRIAHVQARALPAYQFLKFMEDYLFIPKQTLVIGISCSGNTASVVACLEQARQCGACTLSVSGEREGNCMKSAEWRIRTDAHVEYSVDASAYTVSHLFLLYGIFRFSIFVGIKNAALAPSDGELWMERFVEVQQELAILPDLFNRVAETCEQLLRYNEIRNLVVVGTGANRGTAKESALKISEFCWMFCADEELEDFAHGRFRELDISVPLLILSPDEITLAKTKDLLAGCDKSQTPVVVFTSCADDAVRKLATIVVDMPTISDEAMTPFMYVFPMWFIGYYLQQRKHGLVGAKRYDLYATDVNFTLRFDSEGNRLK